MAGPRGDVERTRAGDEGEYHHSRNLIKKMAVGRRILSESRTSLGEARRRRRNTRINPPPFSNGLALVVAPAAAALFMIRLSEGRVQVGRIHAPDPRRSVDEGQPPPTTTKVDRIVSSQKHMQRYKS